MQPPFFLLGERDNHGADVLEGHALLPAVLAQQLIALDAEPRLERAGRRVEAGVADAAVASGGGGDPHLGAVVDHRGRRWAQREGWSRAGSAARAGASAQGGEREGDGGADVLANEGH